MELLQNSLSVSHLGLLIPRKQSSGSVGAECIDMTEKQSGFSLLELMMVCVVLAIIAALAVPNIQRISISYKLNASGRSVAGLLQGARIQAVQTNQPVYVRFDATQNPNLVFSNFNNSTSYATGDPETVLSGGIVFQNGGTVPNPAQLTTYLGGVAVQPAVIGFNGRGLPCYPTGNVQVCSQMQGAVPAAFEWFIQTAGGGDWEAITVTPAGRVKVWRFDGTNWE